MRSIKSSMLTDGKSIPQHMIVTQKDQIGILNKTVAQNDLGIIKTDQFPSQQYFYLLLVPFYASK